MQRTLRVVRSCGRPLDWASWHRAGCFWLLYCNVCRSLFEKDKLLFSFTICTNILKSKNELTNEELMFFLTGGVGLENTKKNPSSGWLSDKSWDEICRMSDLSIFDGFLKSFTADCESWKAVYDS